MLSSLPRPIMTNKQYRCVVHNWHPSSNIIYNLLFSYFSNRSNLFFEGEVVVFHVVPVTCCYLVVHWAGMGWFEFSTWSKSYRRVYLYKHEAAVHEQRLSIFHVCTYVNNHVWSVWVLSWLYILVIELSLQLYMAHAIVETIEYVSRLHVNNIQLDPVSLYGELNIKPRLN